MAEDIEGWAKKHMVESIERDARNNPGPDKPKEEKQEEEDD